MLLVAFGGWNDAGDSATTAIEYPAEQWGATTFADTDPEVFYDFTVPDPRFVSISIAFAESIGRRTNFDQRMQLLTMSM